MKTGSRPQEHPSPHWTGTTLQSVYPTDRSPYPLTYVLLPLRPSTVLGAENVVKRGEGQKGPAVVKKVLRQRTDHDTRTVG